MNRWKFKTWWLLKSPWAKKFGYGRVIKLWLKSKLAAPISNSSKISICVCCYQRLAVLKTVFIPSITKIENAERLEVILACSTSEFEEIEKIVQNHSNIKVVPTDKDFSRSAFLNLALNYSNHPAVLITDIDVALPSNLLELYYLNVNENRAWFPICDMLDRRGEFSHIYPEGVGIVGFIYKGEVAFDESINSWGNEDWSLLFTLFNNGQLPKRTINDGFIHFYHPPVNKKKYKKAW